MRLNKEVCKKCYEKKGWHFQKEAKECWSRLAVVCPILMIMVEVDRPHPDCPYIMEHTVLSQDDVD